MDTRKYAPIESTTCFNFTNLVTKVKNSLTKKYPKMPLEEISELVHESLKTFKLNDQQFDYASNPNYLGGVRWYVQCPKCGNPSLKLYLPSSHADREQIYLCKLCHKLKNASLLMGDSKRYKKVVRPLKQLERLRILLTKKTITPEKAQPFLDEYRRIEQELAASPEYRLWKFQKEHGMPV